MKYKNKKIGVIGVGKIGLCLCLNLEKSNFDVIAYDKDIEKIKKINEKKYFTDDEKVNLLLEKTKIFFTTEIKCLKNAEIIFIVVNTPSLKNGSYNHKNILNCLKELNDYKKNIVIVSTVMPNFCNSLKKENIIYNPTFVAQGNILKNQKNPDFVIIGCKNKNKLKLLFEIYKKMCGNKVKFKIMDLIDAEIVKISINCFLATKISFANMIGNLCLNLNSNFELVLNAIGLDSRIGIKFLKYGYGFGGPCLPRDNKALSYSCKNNNVINFLSKNIDKQNKKHIYQQYDLIKKGFFPEGVCFKNNIFYFKNVSYKENVYIFENSEKLNLALLISKKHKVVIIENKENIKIIKNIFGNAFYYKII